MAAMGSVVRCCLIGTAAQRAYRAPAPSLHTRTERPAILRICAVCAADCRKLLLANGLRYGAKPRRGNN
jgi:hypothetical protein